MTRKTKSKGRKNSIHQPAHTPNSRKGKEVRASKRTSAGNRSFFVIVTELDHTFPRRQSDKAHLYLELSLSPPERRFEQLRQGTGGAYASGHHVRLHPIVDTYREYRSRDDAKAALEDCRESLLRAGHPVNNLKDSWTQKFIVYVLNLSTVGKEKEMMNKDGSLKKGYVYVGQSANTLETRVAQHRREVLSRTGRDLGARATKNRQFTLREVRYVFTKKQSLELEQTLAKHFEQCGFLVDAGHVTPRKVRKKAKTSHSRITRSNK